MELNNAFRMRSGDFCALCGRFETTVHHIVPQRKGGTNEDSNLICLCRPHHKLADRVTRDEFQKLRVWHEPAGQHVEGDPMRLTLFDIDFDKRGLVATTLFRKLCEHLPIPRYLGQFNWTREFVERVYRGEIEGVTFEGVVGKAGEGHKIVMAKAKTQAWYDAVRARYSPETAQRIIES